VRPGPDHVEDCSIFVIYSSGDLTVHALAEAVCETVGFSGDIVTDTTKPDGTPRKVMDDNKLKALGWGPKIDLT